uniref:Uncharacterized protein n=1 Tax=Anguilla anguilla TaxID=7936 RepID=A0A0E9UCD6_ANGAN
MPERQRDVLAVLSFFWQGTLD